NISLIDVKKAVDMFQRLQVPLLGAVENMAYMINPATNERMQLFPKGEIDGYFESLKVPKLGEVPFNPNVGLASEAGIPVIESYPESAEAVVFKQIAEKLATRFT